MKNCCIGIAAGFLLITLSCSEKVKIGSDQKQTFVKFYGANYEDAGNDVKVIPGKGYAIVGTTTNVNTNDNTTSKDVLFLLTDAEGNLKKPVETFGGTADDFGNALALNNDGGFIIAGTSTISGATCVYLIRLNQDGDTVWTRTYPELISSSANAVKVLQDNSILVAGTEGSYGLIMRVDAMGNILNKTMEQLESLQNFSSMVINDVQYIDGNYIHAGYQISSEDGNLLNAGVCDTVGFLPNSAIPANLNQFPFSTLTRIWRSDDGSLILCGSVNGSDGISKALVMNYGSLSLQSPEWLAKLGSTNEKVVGESVRTFGDGRIAVLATRTINDNSDILIFICSSSGQVEKTIQYGGSGVAQEAHAFEITSDGGFIITGSNLLDKNSMVTLIKLNNKGELQ